MASPFEKYSRWGCFYFDDTKNSSLSFKVTPDRTFAPLLQIAMIIINARFNKSLRQFAIIFVTLPLYLYGC